MVKNKNVFTFLKKLRIEIAYNSDFPLLAIYPETVKEIYVFV